MMIDQKLRQDRTQNFLRKVLEMSLDYATLDVSLNERETTNVR